MRTHIEAFSERVGSDPLLIQGAGGNVSWKDGDTLWVKSSGAWLAHARSEDMFVPVDLAGVRSLVEAGGERYVDHRRNGSTLRPSIETALHALMPQVVVAHLHAVDAIAFAVLRDGEQTLGPRLDGLAWMWVPYRKPGAALATQIASQLRGASAVPEVMVLANHGIVFCGPDATAVDDLYHDVLARLTVEPRALPTLPAAGGERSIAGYREIERADTRALAFDPPGLALVRERWVMYPDHAVFLGPAAQVRSSVADAVACIATGPDDLAVRAPCIVVEGDGVWIADSASKAAAAMLDCYADVCRRLSGPDVAMRLTDADIAALLNWEAEAFRKGIAQ